MDNRKRKEETRIEKLKKSPDERHIKTHGILTDKWDDRGKIDNKNKLILTEIFSSVHET